MTEVCIICFSDKYTVKKSKRKDSLARNQDNVFKRDYVSTHGMLLQCAGTNLFILQMINLILTSTDTQSTTFHISSLSEDWLHETSIIPTLFSLKCLCQVRKVNGHDLNCFAI
jgi:CDP-glycerol glycerophosphotransferase (TagB/SpsB family)